MAAHNNNSWHHLRSSLGHLVALVMASFRINVAYHRIAHHHQRIARLIAYNISSSNSRIGGARCSVSRNASRNINLFIARGVQLFRLSSQHRASLSTSSIARNSSLIGARRSRIFAHRSFIASHHNVTSRSAYHRSSSSPSRLALLTLVSLASASSSAWPSASYRGCRAQWRSRRGNIAQRNVSWRRI